LQAGFIFKVKDYIFFKFWDHICLALHLKPIVGSRPYASDIGTDITDAAENSSKFEFKCIPCQGVYFADTFRYPLYSIDCSNKINFYCVVYCIFHTWDSFLNVISDILWAPSCFCMWCAVHIFCYVLFIYTTLILILENDTTCRWQEWHFYCIGQIWLKRRSTK